MTVEKNNQEKKNQDATHRAWDDAMQEGKQHFQQGRMEEAVNGFDRATELLPYRLESWINLGSAFLECQEYSSAAMVLQKAITINPKVMVTHMLLGDALRNLGQKKQAIARYEEAVSLRRTPLALNKLACAVRGRNRREEAEQLYLDALQIAPEFTLAKVNLATLQIERLQYEEAQQQLAHLSTLRLPPLEHQEVASAQVSLAEYHRLNETVDNMCDEGGLEKLTEAMRQLPKNLIRVDTDAMRTVDHHAAAARNISRQAMERTQDLPEDWPLIEGLFMIPHIESVSEYREVKKDLEDGAKAEGDLLESINMAPAIVAARETREAMNDPILAEVHLRHWHKLACENVPGFLPGHFKYTQNWTAKSPTLPRVDPPLASGTMRHIVANLHSTLPPGLPRAILAYLAVTDLHPFADGNGRVGMIWLNRELEWAGLMPVLYTQEMGLKGHHSHAVKIARENPGELTPLVDAILEGQKFAQQFCAELAGA